MKQLLWLLFELFLSLLVEEETLGYVTEKIDGSGEMSSSSESDDIKSSGSNSVYSNTSSHSSSPSTSSAALSAIGAPPRTPKKTRRRRGQQRNINYFFYDDDPSDTTDPPSSPVTSIVTTYDEPATENDDGDISTQTDDSTTRAKDEDSRFSTDEDSRFSTDEDSRFSTVEDSRFSTDEDSRFSTEDDSIFSTDEDSRFSTEEDLRFSTDEDSRLSTEEYSRFLTEEDLIFLNEARIPTSEIADATPSKPMTTTVTTLVAIITEENAGDISIETDSNRYMTHNPMSNFYENQTTVFTSPPAEFSSSSTIKQVLLILFSFVAIVLIFFGAVFVIQKYRDAIEIYGWRWPWKRTDNNETVSPEYETVVRNKLRSDADASIYTDLKLIQRPTSSINDIYANVQPTEATVDMDIHDVYINSCDL